MLLVFKRQELTVDLIYVLGRLPWRSLFINIGNLIMEIQTGIDGESLDKLGAHFKYEDVVRRLNQVNTNKL